MMKTTMISNTDKVAMKKVGMMDKLRGGAWCVMRGVVTVLAGLFIAGTQMSAEANVTVVNDWIATPPINDVTTSPQTMTYTAGAGTDRLLVVAAYADYNANNTTGVTSVTYGNFDIVAAGQFVTDRSTLGNDDNHIWVGWVKESQITAATGSDITVAWNTGGTPNGFKASYALYENVDQTTPIVASSTNSAAATPGDTTAPYTTGINIGGPISVGAGDLAILAGSNHRGGGGGLWHPIDGGVHTEKVDSNGSGTLGVMVRNVFTADPSYNPIMSWANTGNTSVAVAAVVLNEKPACTPTTGPITVTGGAVNGNPISVCSTYALSGATLTDISIDQGGPVLYSGASCSGIDSTGWADGVTNITVTGTDDCGGTINDTGTFNFTSCIATVGPFEVIDGSILSGTTTDVTTALNIDPAYSISNVKVYEVTGAGGDIDELEGFAGGGLTGWGANWTATTADGSTPQADPPANGDLATGTFTRSAGTGPSTTPNAEFVYYESSVGASTDRYLVNSTLYDSSSNQIKVDFKYNMNGADVGTLEFQAKNPGYNGGAWTTEWTLSGNQGDVWTDVSVDLYAGSGASATAYVAGNTELRFRFVYAGGAAGDIALDEVRIQGPRGTGALLFDGTGVEAQTAKTDGTGGFPIWPEGTIRIDITGTDDCGGLLGSLGFGSFVSDTTKPQVDSFNLPLSSLSPIPVYSFTGSDNIAVTHYLITEDINPPTKPAANDSGWSTSKPLKYATATIGPQEFFAWVKDGAGNVSDFIDGVTNQTVTVNPDVTAPVIGQFTLPAASFSPISVTNFTASDDSGTVTGYMITEVGVDADPSGAADPRWLASPPSSLVSASTGSTTFKAWAKDSAGNISPFASAVINILLDNNKPTVSFQLPATHDALTVPITLFTAADIAGGAASNTGVAAYMVTNNSTPPAANDPGWTGTPPSTVTVADETPHTFWGWAKDNSDNVSVAVSSSVTVTLPVSCVFDMDPNGTLIQTENWTAMGAPNPWAWDTVFTALPDASVQTTLNDGNGDLSVDGYIITAAGGTGSNPNGSRADYPVFFPNGTEGNWCIWIRALDQSGNGGGDSNFWGLDGTYVGAMTQYNDNQWAWASGTQNGAKCTNITVNGLDEYPPSSGTFGQWHTFNLWPREQGQKNDMFYLIRNTSNNAAGAFPNVVQNGSRWDDRVTVLPQTAYTEIDPTCVDSTGGGAPGGGGGSGYINIADGQSITGSPIDTKPMFETDLGTPLEYRALGAPTDGFEQQSINPKWFHTNIGNDALLVDTVPRVEGQGFFKLAGSGQDIWNTSDFFAYHYQPGINGDFTIDVNMKNLVDKQTNTTANQNASAKAGIMVRQSLSNNSRNVMMLVTSTNGTRLQSRATDGGTTSWTPGVDNGVSASDNTWLRLKRTGNNFEGFHSTDNGVSWVSVGNTTVSMTGAVNIGLGVTSRNTGRDSIGSFDNFLFMPAGLGGMSEGWTSTTTAIDTSLPTAWPSDTYGLAVRDTGSGTYQANTFGYDPCIDSTLSSITVQSGATVGGSSVSLANLFNYTGNVGGFSYEIDGNAVSNPWNSFALVNSGSTGVASLKVTGTDPDCGGTVYTDTANINIDNTCTDPTPSTITILTGQVVGGPSVDLTKLYSSTGNVADGGLAYKINGVVIGDPTNWDSRQFGAEATDSVSLEVSGIDPDCGNGITAVNNVSVDNGCTRNFPSISFDEDVKHVGKGRAVPYQVTIRNEDSFNCGPSIFTIDLLSDSNGSDFIPSYFNPVLSNIDISLQGRETKVIELAAEANAGAIEWNQNVTTLQITSNYPSHNTPKTTGAVTTKVFLVSPITHNSVTTGSTKWGGNWGTSEAGSQYGNFSCLTCHSKTGSEIKWMRGNIATPDASNWGVSGQATLPIQFKDARSAKEIVADGGDPIADVYWGHDDPVGDGSGRASSDRTCEICHSATQHHRYDTNTDPDGGGPLDAMTITAGATHFPGRDCTDCHRHELGFTADCTGCHGDPPLEATPGGPNGLADIPAATGSVTPGAHYKHTVVLGFECEYCHNGWRNVGEMPKEVNGKQQINHVFNIFFDLGMTDPAANDGHYTGQDGVNYTYDPALEASGQTDSDGTVLPGKGTMTCENIYCHGGTETMGGVNPQWNGNIACNSCHGTSATNTPPGYSHTTHVGKMKLDCTNCHYTGGQAAGYNGHVNGRVNIELNVPGWQAQTPKYDPTPGDGGTGAVVTYNSNADGSDMPPSSQYGSCLNVACHYGNETPVWNNNNQPATCTTCHNGGTNDGVLTNAAPSSGSHAVHVTPAPGTIHETMISSFVNRCESCHGGGANTGDHAGHVNFQVDLGGGLTFSATSQTCTSQCHNLKSDTGGLITWGSTDSLACDSCHAAPYIGPTIVDPDAEGIGVLDPSGYGSHLKATTAETFNASTDWAAQCRKCHPYHADEGGITVFTIPQPDAAWDQLGDGTNMAEKLGLQFPVTGGIHLGGTATGSNATEAEICWGCHDTNGISEWGQNNNAMTGSMIYDYGSVTSSDWTSAVWTSGTGAFTYKTAAIQSTHAASTADGAVTGVDPVAAIRCTYCHDVHDRNKALVDLGAGTTESLTGAPFLRGTWMGNPYNEDGAPQSGTNYTARSIWGAVPRGGNTAVDTGGYYIDQNSGSPVTGNYDGFGGICQNCHGTDINALNQYGTQGAGWVSDYNGHANVVKGGAGPGSGAELTARNIFGGRGGATALSDHPYMIFDGMSRPGDNNRGFRVPAESRYRYTPSISGWGGGDGPKDGSGWNNATRWGVEVRGATTEANFHQFSCSKCHNPHASRLPKLMITNCLDTKQNTWDNNYQVHGTTDTINQNRSLSNWSSAQNCHRLGGNDTGDNRDTAATTSLPGNGGWNLVTPWTDADGNYGTQGDQTQDNNGTW